MIRSLSLIFMLVPLQITCMQDVKEIKKNLLLFFNKDQELRKKALTLTLEKNETSRQEIFNYLGIDSLNEQHYIYLKGIIDLYGWPRISQFGQETCQHAWILVQHCLDNHFQKQCLQRMEALDPQEVDQKLIAYLHDRIQINTGLPQRYGTQCDTHGEILPLESFENVEQLRISVGLEPLSEYQKKCKKIYKNK